MTAYITQSEVKSLWKSSLRRMISECRTDKKVPEGLVELIRHNLFAKYVSYNAALDKLEIGVNESRQRTTTYPTIKIYSFPLNDVENKLLAIYQPGRGDLEFYAKILKGKDLNGRMVVL